MSPLSEFPLQERARVRVALTDIDDTLTVGGRLPALAYSALEDLRSAGILVVPVTGRPAGWCDLIARQWPVDGVVGENGAFYFRYRDDERRMARHYARTPSQRVADRRRLDAALKTVLARVRGSAISADQAFREADIAIDVSEDVAPLSRQDVGTIVGILTESGAKAKVSSIHVNGWFGDYDKLSMSLTMLRAEFGVVGNAIQEQVAFIGDSPNDAPMFSFFKHSIGVANVRQFISDLTPPPRWVTDGVSASGFAEFARHLIEARHAHQHLGPSATRELQG